MPDAGELLRARPAPDAPSPAGPFPLRGADFEQIAGLLYQDTGIVLSPSKVPLVYARLAKRLRTLQLRTFAEYVALVQAEGAPERRQMVAALTTNVTRFFREPHHFEHVHASVLPGLRDHVRRGARLRLWSAACSTGQEPYSLAALIADALPEHERAGLKILATDIDDDVLAQARTGQYESIDGVPATLRRFFHRSGSGWIVDAALRRLVAFRSLNLNAPWPVKGPFDLIFCRNVAIYFDQAGRDRLWLNCATVLAAGGHLYTGHSERVGGPAAALFDSVAITTYRRKGKAP